MVGFGVWKRRVCAAPWLSLAEYSNNITTTAFVSFYELSQATDETGYMYMDHTLWTGYTQALGIGRGVHLLSVGSVEVPWPRLWGLMCR